MKQSKAEKKERDEEYERGKNTQELNNETLASYSHNNQMRPSTGCLQVSMCWRSAPLHAGGPAFGLINQPPRPNITSLGSCQPIKQTGRVTQKRKEGFKSAACSKRTCLDFALL